MTTKTTQTTKNRIYDQEIEMVYPLQGDISITEPGTIYPRLPRIRVTLEPTPLHLSPVRRGYRDETPMDPADRQRYLWLTIACYLAWIVFLAGLIGLVVVFFAGGYA